MIQAVHFQFMTDKGKLAKKLFSADRQFLASIVPDLLDRNLKTEIGEDIFGRIHPPENYYPDWAIDIFKANRNNPHVVWVQEGYRHCCGRCFNKRENGKSPDPFHEHVCLDGHAQILEEQIDEIINGKELIFNNLGIMPEGYCPPNHLYNIDTIGTANLAGFKLFLTRNGFDYFKKGLVKLPAYWADDSRELIMLPESKYGSSPVKTAYYDKMSETELNDFLTSSDFSQRLFELPVRDKPKAKAWLNERAIRTYKRLRDVVNK